LRSPTPSPKRAAPPKAAQMSDVRCPMSERQRSGLHRPASGISSDRGLVPA